MAALFLFGGYRWIFMAARRLGGICSVLLALTAQLFQFTPQLSGVTAALFRLTPQLFDSTAQLSYYWNLNCPKNIKKHKKDAPARSRQCLFLRTSLLSTQSASSTIFM
ncbi:hypothetical protein [Falsibacillus pallidus]|uniref:hypothetical protein n=1 Tax=Falsibacillus pallidus TaxID=493781 RepID=UPI0011C06D6A|nr:hypothetical protein [Falsibacillus pallidus]